MGYKINYTGVDKSDALEHWKYIKREKVGGKWRYWYESPSGKVIGHKPTVTEKVSKDAEYAINRIKDYANSTESEREKDSKRREVRNNIDNQINKGVDYVNGFLDKNSSKPASKDGSFMQSVKNFIDEAKDVFEPKKEASSSNTVNTTTSSPKINVRDATPKEAREMQRLIEKKKKKEARKAKFRNFLKKIFPVKHTTTITSYLD